jgi:mono/diheme cytochrome c family protein
LIVPSSDSRVSYTVLDHDLVELDTETLQVSRYARGIGTNLLGLETRPGSAEVWVSHTESRNLIRFEPALNGRFALNRLGVFDAADGAVDVIDLNPGVDYDLLPNPGAQAVALSQPTAMEFEADGAHVWTAAFASDRVARVRATDGAVLARVDLRAAGEGTEEMRGPRGLALQTATGRLYVLNKLKESVSVIDTQAAEPAVVAEVALSPHEPLPPNIKSGRGYLYDARLSGNGLVSCGICHMDADRDGLAWDLGVPDGPMLTVLGANLSVHDTTPRSRVMHPMKGPMTTQTLRGMAGGAPFHWRGDRPGIADFNPTFADLLGGEQISAEDMADLEAYLLSLRHHPNPNRNLDRTLPAVLGNGNPVAGRDLYNSHDKSHCVTCHAFPGGSDNNIDLPRETGLLQPVKTSHLRTVYQRNYLNPAAGAVSRSGFGLLHDGTGFEMPTVHPYVLDNLNTTKELRDVSAFLLCFDTGTAPTVGHGVLVDATNRSETSRLADLAVLEARAIANDCDLVVRGVWQGTPRRWLFQKAEHTYRADRAAGGQITRTALLNGLSGDDAVVLQGVFPGHGARFGGDADLDGLVDGDDPSLATYDGAPRIVVEPRDQAMPPGGELRLQVQVRAGSPGFQWFKGNQLLSGETSAVLSRSGVTAADAGSYRVTVQNSLGSATSRTAIVEVYAVPVITVPPVARLVNEGQAVSFTVSATGAALKYQWLRGGQPINGATGRTLSFAGVSGLDVGSYAVTVFNGAGSVTSAAVNLAVVERPVVPVQNLPAGIIGQVYSAPLTASNGPTRFVVTGLPRGLSVPRGKLEIAGRPVVSGTFPLRIVAYNSAGSSLAVRQATLVVNRFPERALGAYEAVLPRSAPLNSGLGGYVSVSTFSSSGFSGVLQLGGAIHRFRNAWTVSETESPRATVRFSRRSAPELVLELRLDPVSRALEGRVVAGADELVFSGGGGAVLDPLAYAGAHTLALRVPLAFEGDESKPQGDGIGGFIVSAKGIASGALRLADDTAFSFAAPVTEGGWVRVAQPLYRNTGSCLGSLQLTPATRRMEASQITWSKSPNLRTRSYPDGFEPLSLRVVGGPYAAPVKGQTLPGLDNAAVVFVHGKVPDPATRLNLSEVVFPATVPSRASITGANPGFVALTLQPGVPGRFSPGSTGAFWGSFRLSDPDRTVAGEPLRARSAVIRGMAVDDGTGYRGFGFFLLPEMPSAGPPLTTLRTSPIRSGRARLDSFP